MRGAADRPCLEQDGKVWRYDDLLQRAAALAAAWDRIDASRAPVAVLCDHSLLGYAAVVAALVSGRPYVPLHPALPSARISTILETAGCRVAVVDAERIEGLRALFEAKGTPIATEAVRGSVPSLQACRAPNLTAYILFTSGSTGEPKGVVVGRAALDAYCRAAGVLFPLRAEDRCTQLFDLSFDLSVHDVLCTFLAGACLVVDRERQRIDPVGFAAEARASVWFSVPSVIGMARSFRRLRPGALPDLRLALFCGEALSVPLAQDFLAAAPKAEAFNLYGPTEATIAITSYRLDRATLPNLGEPWVPIGSPYPASESLVVDECGQPAAEGVEGELWLGGPQLAEGYLGAPELTARQFISARFAGYAAERWYRSGDRAVACRDHGLLFRGRLDQQVKIAGHRVELGEVENALLATGLVGEAAAFVQPVRGGGLALACAVTAPLAPVERILAAARSDLPPYMVPSRVLVLDALPRSAHGKIDRRALAMMDSVAAATTR